MRCHVAAWSQASLITQLPTSTIIPVSSSSGMIRSGRTTPRVGWRQRKSASTPTQRRGRVRSKTGW